MEEAINMIVSNDTHKIPDTDNNIINKYFYELFYDRITLQAKVESCEVYYDEGDFYKEHPQHIMEISQIRDTEDGTFISNYKQIYLSRPIWRKLFEKGDFIEFNALVGVWRKRTDIVETNKFITGLDDVMETIKSPRNIQLIKEQVLVPVNHDIKLTQEEMSE